MLAERKQVTAKKPKPRTATKPRGRIVRSLPSRPTKRSRTEAVLFGVDVPLGIIDGSNIEQMTHIEEKTADSQSNDDVVETQVRAFSAKFHATLIL